MFARVWKRGTEKTAEKVISCQLHVDKTNRGTSWVLHSYPLPVSCFGLLNLSHSCFPLLKGVTFCPASHSTAMKAGQKVRRLLLFQASLICCPSQHFVFVALWQYFSLLLGSSRTPCLGSHERGRAGAVLSQPATTLAGSCSWSKGHLAPGTEPQPSNCFEHCALTGKQWRTEKHQSTLLFLPPSPSLVCCTGAFLVCLTVYFWQEAEGVVGPGPCSHQQGFQSLHLTLSLYNWLDCRTSTGCLFSLSVCFHYLQSAFLQFLPFLGSQLAPVNTNNINASDFCHSCDKAFSRWMSCGFSLAAETDDTAAHF